MADINNSSSEDEREDAFETQTYLEAGETGSEEDDTDMVEDGEARALAEPPQSEQILIQQLRDLEDEELVEEEESGSGEDLSDEESRLGDGGAGGRGGFTFDPSVTSLHSYLGDFNYVQRNFDSTASDGSFWDIPMFYLEGIVLFPEQKLPLRVRQPRFVAAVHRAMESSTAPNIIGVVLVGRFPGQYEVQAASVGTTAEICQERVFPDGSISVLARGKQRFHVKKAWSDLAPMATVHISEDLPPLRVPSSVFCQLAARPSPLSCPTYRPRTLPPASLAFWPDWTYRIFDVYYLSRRVADRFQAVLSICVPPELPQTPASLAWYVARNLPVSDCARQKLLEEDRLDTRLRLILGFLGDVDRLRCRVCKVVIARRADIMPMSAEGPIGAFVNSHGFVHETLTLTRASGLILEGPKETKDSWFPGYAWTIAYCGSCGSHIGWRFTAVNKRLIPRAFWGVRRPQITTQSDGMV